MISTSRLAVIRKHRPVAAQLLSCREVLLVEGGIVEMVTRAGLVMLEKQSLALKVGLFEVLSALATFICR